MSGAGSQNLGTLAKLVIVLAVLLFVAGVVWHGVTYATIQRLCTTCSRERTRR